MVVIGGIAQAMMLPVIGVGTIYLRHRRLPRRIAPGGWVTVGLWIATFIFICVAAYLVALELLKETFDELTHSGMKMLKTMF
jgi:hypothetical protein